MYTYAANIKNFLIYILLFAGFNIATAQTTPEHNKQAKNYLFVLSAQEGILSKKNQKYYLLLKNVDSHTLWFTDRPVRQAGFLDTSKLISNWTAGFGEGSPNAGFVYAGMSVNVDGHQTPLALELMAPKQNSSNGDISFEVKNLSAKLFQLKPQSFSQVHLFIDPPAARLLDFHQEPLGMPAM